MYIAAWKNYPEVVNALVEAGADLNIPKEVKYTMIMLWTDYQFGMVGPLLSWLDGYRTVRPNQYHADYQDRFETSMLSCLSAADYI